jgi:hypothetical protein
MNQALGIAIIISAVTLVGTAAMAVNYSPAPAHAFCKGWLLPGSQGQICFQTKKSVKRPYRLAAHSNAADPKDKLLFPLFYFFFKYAVLF